MNGIQNLTIKSEISSASNNTTVTVYFMCGESPTCISDYEYTQSGEIGGGCGTELSVFRKSTIYPKPHIIYTTSCWAIIIGLIHTQSLQTPYYSSVYSLFYCIYAYGIHAAPKCTL